MLEDKLLVWKFNRGNRDCLRIIYEKYKNDLVTLAAALLIDVGAAEDVVHDVFVSFLKSAETFRLTGSLKGYLATCVANNARNKNKAGRKHASSALDKVIPMVVDSIGPESNAIFGEELRRLSEALGRLPYEQREVLILRTYSGMTFRTIAKQQGVSINTALGRYRYAMDKLHSLLNGEVEQ